MALRATIYKLMLGVSDIDRNLYQDFSLTIARHPSETEERMMVRIIAFACHASDDLAFTRGLSSDDEPELWQKNAVGEIETWIEIGLPSEERIRKACSRAKQVAVYAYGTERNMDAWWQKIADRVARFRHLRVMRVPATVTQRLPGFVCQSMQLQCTIQDGELWLSDDKNNIQITLQAVTPAT